MAQKRIFELAKELNVDSKIIIQKCWDEGISKDVVKNHMSAISIGLAESIREWFGGHIGGTATAVEPPAEAAVSTEPQGRKPAPKKAKASGSGGSDGSDPSGGGSATGVATHVEPKVQSAVEASHGVDGHAPPTLATPIHAGRAGAASGHSAESTQASHPAPATSGHSGVHHQAGAHQSDSHQAAAVSLGASGSASSASGHGASTASHGSNVAPHATSRPTPSAVPAGPLTAKVIAPSTPVRVEPSSSAPAVTHPGHGSNTTHATHPPHGAGQHHDRDPGGGHGPGAAASGGPSGGSTAQVPHSAPRASSSVKPAPANIPTRPTVVAPAGQKLEVQKVKLSGPKVVRVEAPEHVEAPRARRPSPSSGPGVGAGGAARPRTGEEDDRGRSPRRGPAGGGKGPVPAGPAKRTGAVAPNRRASADWSTPGIFSEQDLLEREARLARAGGTIKKHRQDLNKGPSQRAETPAEIGGSVRITAPFTIKDLSATTGVKGADIVKKLFLQGIMATINSGIDPVKAQEIMLDFDIELEVEEAQSAEQTVHAEFEQRKVVDERPRGPVVTILGHVDHGKTSLLDRIRNANVAAGEAGGITQRTSAFRATVEVAGEKKEVVFLDTPGHEAFTSMRARGATMTDVVVLVVSAPEGVMPQTVESINHAKAAKVPIVVALNKIDRPDATEGAINRTLGQLAEAGLNPVQWGGDTEVVKVSAVTGVGIPELLETLDYQSQLRELKADFGGMAAGTVIEARTEEGRGAVASLLVQQGKLKVGDFIVAGRGFGRVRDITDDHGSRIRESMPPMPVVISGIDEVPNAGDRFYVVDSLKKAQDAAEQRRRREREQQLAAPKVTLDSFFSQIAEKDTKEILIVLKAAEQGTVDVLRGQCEKIQTPEVKTRVLHAAIGGIVESDVILAEASKAIIIGFNVIPSGKARTLAEQKGVEIRTYQVIYDIVDDLKKAAEGMLTPELRQEILGHAEVRQVFKVTKVGSIAGCYVTDGTVQRDALIRVTRNGVVIENDRRLEQLKRFKDDAKEVRMGMECGMKIAGYDDIKEGDVLECYKQVEVKRTL